MLILIINYIYLWIKKIEVRSIYTYLKKSNTNINFEKVFVTKEFVLNKTGKININNLVKKVNGKNKTKLEISYLKL